MYTVMPDQSSVVMETEYRMRELRRDSAYDRLAQIAQSSDESTPTAPSASAKVIRFHRLTTALAALITLR